MDVDMNEPTVAEQINDRAHILGLQLQVEYLSAQLHRAVGEYGNSKPEQQVRRCIAGGFIAAHLEAAERQLQQLTSLQQRLAAQAATTRGRDHQAGLAAAHAQAWVQQQQATISNLKDVLQPFESSEFLQYLRNAPAPTTNLQLPRSGLDHSKGPHGVAHFIGDVPAELAPIVHLPSPAYGAGCHAAAAEQPSPCCSTCQQQPPQRQEPAAGPLQPGSAATPSVAPMHSRVWAGAPSIMDPAERRTLYIARHATFELMLTTVQDGDVILLQPGRYALKEGTLVLRSSVRIIGLGRRQQDVVLHNHEEDDAFVECHAQFIQFENLTLLQLGGYDGIVQVHAGRTTMLNSMLQCSMSGAWVRQGATVVMHGCKLFGAASSGLQVEAGGCVELYDTEVSQCGLGDEIVPPQLGGIEVHVHPVTAAAAFPNCVSVLNVEDLQDLCTTWLRAGSKHQAAAAAQSACDSPHDSHAANVDAAVPQAGAIGKQPCSDVQQNSYEHSRCGVNGVAACKVARHGTGAGQEETVGWEDVAKRNLCMLQQPASVVVGPGCAIVNNRGFGISVVKPRALAAYHEAKLANSIGGAAAAACEGAHVYVHGGIALSGNSRGPLGVVDLGYVEMAADDVEAGGRAGNRQHFHAVQVSSKHLREGIASRGVDWSFLRAGVANSGGRSKGRPTAAAGVTRANGAGQRRAPAGSGAVGAAAAKPGASSGQQQASALCQLLCEVFVQATNQQVDASSSDASDSTSDKEDSNSSAEAAESAPESDGAGAAAVAAAAALAAQEDSRTWVECTFGAVASTVPEETYGQPDVDRYASAPLVAMQPMPIGGSPGASWLGNHTNSVPVGMIGHAPARQLRQLHRSLVALPGPESMPSLVMSRYACWLCGKVAAPGMLKKCAACRLARYCGADCQSTHWPQHQPYCKFWRKSQASAEQALAME